MTAEEYLGQAKRIDQRLRFCREEISRLNALSVSVSSPTLGEKTSSSMNTTASYVRIIEMIEEKKQEESRLMATALKFEEEAKSAIYKLKNPDEKLILLGKFFYHRNHCQIAEELQVSTKTVQRLLKHGLKRLDVPKNPITIDF